MITPLTAVQFVVLLKAVLQVPAVHPAPTTQLRLSARYGSGTAGPSSTVRDASRYGSSPSKPLKKDAAPTKYGGKPSGETQRFVGDWAGEPSFSTPPHLARRPTSSFSSAPVSSRPVAAAAPSPSSSSSSSFSVFGRRRDDGVPYKRFPSPKKEKKAKPRSEPRSEDRSEDPETIPCGLACLGRSMSIRRTRATVHF